MSTNKQSSESSQTPEDEVWPHRLNKLLIGIGVLAFGLIIADRLTHMFKADDLPAVVDVQQSDEAPNAAISQTDDSMAVEPDGEEQIALSEATEEEIAADPLSIDEVFGGSLIFVSASEPVYVMTENEVRIDVGSPLNGDFTLAGVTGDRVILRKDGELMSMSLPDPDMR